MSGTWKNSRIGAVCEVVAGQSPEGEFYNDSGDGLPFYQGKKEFQAKFIAPPKIWTRKVTKVALPGDVLMSVRAPVGPVNFATEKSCIGRGLAAIRASNKIDRSFLFYFLFWKESEISGNEGAVFSSINRSQIEEITIPLPSVPEQKRIVAILDEAIEGIDAAVANAEKNLGNARELFERCMSSALDRQSDTRSRSVRELAASVRGSIRTGPFGSQLLHGEFVDAGIAVLGIDNVAENRFTWNRRRYITAEKYADLRRYTVKPGDVLISIMGTCRRCAVVPNDIELAINSKSLSGIIVFSGRVF